MNKKVLVLTLVFMLLLNMAVVGAEPENSQEGMEIELSGVVEPAMIDVEFSKTVLNLDIDSGKTLGEDSFEVINHTQAPLQLYLEEFEHVDYNLAFLPETDWENMDVSQSSDTIGFVFNPLVINKETSHIKYLGLFGPIRNGGDIVTSTDTEEMVEGLFKVGEITELGYTEIEVNSRAGLRRGSSLNISGTADWIVSIDELN